MSVPTPLLYQGITDQVQEQLLEFQDAIDILQYFNHIPTNDNTIQDLIWRWLGPIGEASLSSALWDPTKVKHAINVLTLHRYSSGIEKNLDYEDWKILLKMGNVVEANMQQIVEKPAIQMGYYFLQGKKLLDDGSQGDPPISTQYNFALDVGANTLASTLVRPIGVNQVTGSPNRWQASAGAWSTYADMATDINNLISTLVEKGFTNKAAFIIFYPLAAEGALAKKRASGGDGMRNAFQEFEDLGISRTQLVAIDNKYLYTRAGALPTRALFDIVAIDTSKVRIYDIEAKFVNVFMDNTGAHYPGMNVECGQITIPIFLPEWNVSDEKYYKGVCCIRAIVGT